MSEEIKAKIIIEADTSGATEAAAALEKLQGIAGDFSSGGAGSIGDAISQMSEGFAEGTKGAEGFADAIGAGEEAVKSGEEAVSSYNDALGEHQQVTQDAATAQEAFSGQVEETAKQLQAVPTSMQEVTKSTQSMSEQMAKSSDTFASFQQAFSPETLAENMSVFQDLATTPQPMMMLQSYLKETGQDLEGFTQSIGKSYSAIHDQMYQSASAITDVQTAVGAQSDSFTAMATSAGNAGKAVEQVDAAINKFGGIGSSQYGPLTLSDSLAQSWGLAGNEAEKAMAQMGLAEGGGLGGVFKGAFGELGGVLNSASQFVMPLMALQMVGTMVAQVGQSIYDSAAIAEGPAAHSMGTFTGTVDALGQSMQRSGQIFSESFGQNMLPTLNALNDQMNQGGGSNLGGIAGSTVSFLSNMGLLVGGLTTIGMNPFSNQMIQSGGEGLINQVAQAFGFQQPFQGPGPQQQTQMDYQQQLAQMPMTVMKSTEQLQVQTAQMLQEGMDPQYLQAQEQATVAQQFLQRQQASFDAAHPTSWRQLALDYQNQQATLADQSAYRQYLASGGSPITPDNPNGTGGGGFFGGLGSFVSGMNNLFSGGLAGGGLDTFAKNIMSLGQGFANFTGFGQIPTGSVGPIQSAGFLGNMSGGGIGTEAVQLSHTFVANVTWEAHNLEHQATAVAHWAEQNVQHAITAVANWTEQNIIHPIVAVAQWTEQNVIHPVVAAAQWAEQNVMHAVTAVAQWTEQNLQHAVQAVAQWTEQNVIHPVTAVAEWAEKNLEHTFLGIATWIGQNLTHTFVGVAQWIQQTITSVIPAFAEGTSNAPGGPAIVGEAGSEVIGHNGQYMLVDQPSFVNLPSGASVYPMQDIAMSSSPRMFADGTGGSLSLVPLGSVGGGGAQTANIHVYLDSQTLISALGVSLASSIRVGMGQRSY